MSWSSLKQIMEENEINQPNFQQDK